MARVLFRVIHTAGIHCQYCIFLLTIQVESQFTRMQYEVFNKSLHSLGCRFWMANDIKNLLVVGTWVLTFLTFLEVTVLNLLVNPHQELRFIKSFFLQSHSNNSVCVYIKSKSNSMIRKINLDVSLYCNIKDGKDPRDVNKI